MSSQTAVINELVTPGVRVGRSETHDAGPGVYESDGVLFAALVGTLAVNSTGPGRTQPALSVTHSRADARGKLVSLPEIGTVVSARITRVTPRAAHVELLAADGVLFRDVFKGTIRQQDVRQMETDTVELYKCFRPRDVVVAEVISLGDRHSYFLSTAKNELGVVYAVSAAGEVMAPISWEAMECPTSKVVEPRKVARQ
jgi:exosome complex component CSL4